MHGSKEVCTPSWGEGVAEALQRLIPLKGMKVPLPWGKSLLSLGVSFVLCQLFCGIGGMRLKVGVVEIAPVVTFVQPKLSVSIATNFHGRTFVFI